MPPCLLQTDKSVVSACSEVMTAQRGSARRLMCHGTKNHRATIITVVSTMESDAPEGSLRSTALGEISRASRTRAPLEVVGRRHGCGASMLAQARRRRTVVLPTAVRSARDFQKSLHRAIPPSAPERRTLSPLSSSVASAATRGVRSWRSRTAAWRSAGAPFPPSSGHAFPRSSPRSDGGSSSKAAASGPRRGAFRASACGSLATAADRRRGGARMGARRKGTRASRRLLRANRRHHRARRHPRSTSIRRSR
jgi:hypothetical protein